MAEAYRRQEFAWSRECAGGADGGVDIRPSQERGNPPRSMQAVAIEQGRRQHCPRDVRRNDGTEGGPVIIVTSGHFTREAQDFAAGKPIQLVDGCPQLAGSHRPGARGATGAVEIPRRRIWRDTARAVAVISYYAPRRRDPTPGPSSGGCSAFPKCRHTEPVMTDGYSAMLLRVATQLRPSVFVARYRRAASARLTRVCAVSPARNWATPKDAP